MLQVFRDTPDRKVVYIAPLKALVRERVSDWRKNLCPTLNKKLVELTGDYTPDLRSLLSADIIVWYALRFPNPTHSVLPKLVTVVHTSRYTRTRRDVLPLLIQDVNHFSCTKTAPPRSGTGFRGTGARGRTSRKSRWWWYALRVSQNPARRLFYLSAGDCSGRLRATVRTDYGRLFGPITGDCLSIYRPIHGQYTTNTRLTHILFPIADRRDPPVGRRPRSDFGNHRFADAVHFGAGGSKNANRGFVHRPSERG